MDAWQQNPRAPIYNVEEMMSYRHTDWLARFRGGLRARESIATLNRAVRDQAR